MLLNNLSTSARDAGRIPLEEKMATHSSILAWEVLWTEEPGGLESMGLQRVRPDWAHTNYLSIKWTKVKMLGKTQDEWMWGIGYSSSWMWLCNPGGLLWRATWKYLSKQRENTFPLTQWLTLCEYILQMREFWVQRHVQTLCCMVLYCTYLMQ